MSRIIKMVDEIKEYYNLNDTLLASDLGIMQQTIRGWRDGRQPSLLNYNKVKKMYEEMKQEAVDNSIVQRFEALEEKVEKERYLPYRVKIPTDLEKYYTIDIDGTVEELSVYTNELRVLFYLRGLAFKTRGLAKQHLEESMLLFKLHKWAEEHSGGWIPDWEDWQERKYIVEHDTSSKKLKTAFYVYLQPLTKLPYFKSEEIAKQFIEEFGEEIKEVLC